MPLASCFEVACPCCSKRGPCGLKADDESTSTRRRLRSSSLTLCTSCLRRRGVPYSLCVKVLLAAADLRIEDTRVGQLLVTVLLLWSVGSSAYCRGPLGQGHPVTNFLLRGSPEKLSIVNRRVQEVTKALGLRHG